MSAMPVFCTRRNTIVLAEPDLLTRIMQRFDGYGALGAALV
jgi:hypothetical protein